MSKLIRWETPFSDEKFPAVKLLISNDGDFLSAIVAPEGIDKYPKYLVKFADVIAFTCMEEAYSPQREYSNIKPEENSCAYEWIDSSWLKSYEHGEHFIASGKPKPFYHYLIFGGDNNIEVITPNKPEIETISEKTVLKINYML
jgi:hypothetical protein